MKFEVYCDEAYPDLFTSKNPNAHYLMIGSLWLPSELRLELKEKIKGIRAKHNAWGEIKWSKISASKLLFYFELIDLFAFYGTDMRFRCIAVEREHVNLQFHNQDGELGFYKFYYQLLHHWIQDFNEYDIYCDVKKNRDPLRLHTLKKYLDASNISSTIKNIQSLPSRQLVLIQFCDFLLGAASSRMNNTLRVGSAKEAVVQYLEKSLGVEKLIKTVRDEQKFNVFKIRLKGGW